MSGHDCKHGSLARSCEVCTLEAERNECWKTIDRLTEQRKKAEGFWERAEKLEAELQSLRAGISYVRGRLESHARALEGWHVGTNDEVATALREDAERLRQCGGESNRG